MLLLAGLLGGCATVVPNFDVPKDPAGSPTVRSIVDEITCELSEMVVDPKYNDFLIGEDLNAVFLLDLTVKDGGTLAPSFNYMTPKFLFSGGFTLDQSRSQQHTEKLYYSMRELKQGIIPGLPIAACNHDVDTNLAGNLGLRQSINMARSSPNLFSQEKLSPSPTNGVFGGSVLFIVTKSLDKVGPTWMLTNFKGPGGFASASEVNTDKLSFAFARGDQAGKPLSGQPRKSVDAFRRAEVLLDQITFNQLSTQINALRQGN